MKKVLKCTGVFSTPAIAVDGSQIGLYSFTARWSWLPRTFGIVLNRSLGNVVVGKG